MTEYPSFKESPPRTPYDVPNSTTAVVSLVAGILGLTFLPLIGSIVALITGSMAKTEILQSAGTVGGEGLARVGIILGWIGIGLAVFGACLTGVMLVIPLCLVGAGLTSGEWGMLIPAFLSII